MSRVTGHGPNAPQTLEDDPSNCGQTANASPSPLTAICGPGAPEPEMVCTDPSVPPAEIRRAWIGEGAPPVRDMYQTAVALPEASVPTWGSKATPCESKR